MLEQHPVGGELAVQKRIQQRQLVWIVYVLYALVPLSAGLTGLFAVVINYFQRGSVRGSPYEAHFIWQIRLFWESIFWLVLGFLTVWFYYLGLFFLLIGLGRFIYRLVLGFYCLNRGKSLPIQPSTEP
jgi:uncharacterized membrane protein